jgi:hypothetical protein
MLKKLILIAFFISSAVFAQSKADKIRTLLDATGSEKTIETMKTQFTDIVRKASPSVPTTLLDSLFSRMNKEGFYKIAIPIYDHNLNEKTIDALISFYQSKAGKIYVSKLPDILKESMQSGSVWGQQIMLEIINEIQKRGYKINKI